MSCRYGVILENLPSRLPEIVWWNRDVHVQQEWGSHFCNRSTQRRLPMRANCHMLFVYNQDKQDVRDGAMPGCFLMKGEMDQ